MLLNSEQGPHGFMFCTMTGEAHVLKQFIMGQRTSLTCVCPLMGLERLLSGKHSVADVTTDTAG